MPLHTGKANAELESEEPPPWLTKEAAYAPSISDSIDSQYRLANVGGGGRDKADHTMLLHNADIKQPPAEKLPCVTDFHHDEGSMGKASRSNHIVLPEPLPTDADTGYVCAGGDDADLIDAEFSRMLGSVIDRCFLLCHDFEWQAWQSRATIGSKGSRVFSRSQARSIAQRADVDSQKASAETTLVLELEVLQAALDCSQDGKLRLAYAVRLTSVKSVYKLGDFLTLLRMATTGGSSYTAPPHQRPTLASIDSSLPATHFRDDASISTSTTLSPSPSLPPLHRGGNDARDRAHDNSGASNGNGEGEHMRAGGAYDAYSLGQSAMAENAWMLDDFEELLTRRKYRGVLLCLAVRSHARPSSAPCVCVCVCVCGRRIGAVSRFLSFLRTRAITSSNRLPSSADCSARPHQALHSAASNSATQAGRRSLGTASERWVQSTAGGSRQGVGVEAVQRQRSRTAEVCESV